MVAALLVGQVLLPHDAQWRQSVGRGERNEQDVALLDNVGGSRHFRLNKR